MDKKILKIPSEVATYASATEKIATYISPTDKLIYEPTKGEVIDVIFWVRYPDYDMIFGVPEKSNARFEKEVGFFQLRDTRAKTVKKGFYIDIAECEELIKGFTKILEVSKEHSKHLWHNLPQK